MGPEMNGQRLVLGRRGAVTPSGGESTAHFAIFKVAWGVGCDRIRSMPGVLNARPAGEAYLNDRCCLTCGYRGRELQGRRGAERLVCPRCRQDLYARPARTYAEMEGLVLVELKPAPPPGVRTRIDGITGMSSGSSDS